MVQHLLGVNEQDVGVGGLQKAGQQCDRFRVTGAAGIKTN